MGLDPIITEWGDEDGRIEEQIDVADLAAITTVS